MCHLIFFRKNLLHWKKGEKCQQNVEIDSFYAADIENHDII